MNIDEIVLSGLVFSEDYARKTLPFLKDEYFETNYSRIIFGIINSYFLKYNRTPTKEVLDIELQAKGIQLSQDEYGKAQSTVKNLEVGDHVKSDWLIDTTERWCKDRALFIALSKSIKISKEDSGSLSIGAIPKILQEALAVSFDTKIGHDYFLNWQHQYEYYHLEEYKIPFDLEFLNEITKGGVSRKTLNILLAPTGVGKTMFMCHFATSNLLRGKNVLYITLEMAEERIRERIDANILDVKLHDLEHLTKESYERKIKQAREKTQGNLIIREYPATTVSVLAFRHLIDELKLKKNFVPDIVYIDYLNLCASARVKKGSTGSYDYIKSIAEEIRGFAVEYNIPIISATQTNRGGFNNLDIELTDTSESIGLPATVDLMLGIMVDDNLRNMNQVLFKQLKNRYEDENKRRYFVIGVDRPKMRCFDTEQPANEKITHDVPVFDNTQVGTEMNDDEDNIFSGLDSVGISKKAKEIFKEFK
jgi:hypothetical protein